MLRDFELPLLRREALALLRTPRAFGGLVALWAALFLLRHSAITVFKRHWGKEP